MGDAPGFHQMDPGFSPAPTSPDPGQGCRRGPACRASAVFLEVAPAAPWPSERGRGAQSIVSGAGLLGSRPSPLLL